MHATVKLWLRLEVDAIASIAVPGNPTGVTVDTRPFTDIATDLTGNFTGAVVAQGNNLQAGVGNLFTFDAVFTANYIVAQAGDITFNFYSDDGFVFGVGNGATRVSGSLTNAPSQTPFQGYPVLGAYDQPTAPVANSVTVHFPAPGTYPYEVDYSECCGGQVALTMATSSTGHGVAPAGNLTLTPQNAPTQPVGQAVRLTVSAMDAGGMAIANLPVTATVTGPNAQQLTATTNASGRAVFSYVGTTAGFDQVEAGANVSGMPAISNVAGVPWAYSVPGASSGSASAPPPLVTAPSPADGAVVTIPTPVTAQIQPPPGQSIASWAVNLQPSGGGAATILASASGTPPATLATLDPTLLPNGTYTLTVTATASGGGVETEVSSVAIAGALKPGRLVTTYDDLSVPVNGLVMSVQRTYDSYDKSSGDFGVGWHLKIANFRTQPNRQLGLGGWTEYPVQCFIICNYQFRSSAPHFVTVVFPDGHQERFDFTPDGPGLTLVDFASGTARFTAAAGVTSTLAVTDPAARALSYGFDGNLYDQGGNPYNPTRFTLTTRAGTSYILDTTTGLVQETDRAGNSLSVDAGGVHSSAGPSLTFQRDGQGRISAIGGPSGEHLVYGYSAAGDLTQYTDGAGNIATYTYDTSHNLTGADSADGVAAFTEHYDPSGRVDAVTDAAGHTTYLVNDVSNLQQHIVDANGQLVTIDTYDPQGDLLQEDRAFGSTTLTTKHTYDSAGRVLTTTDPTGAEIQATYDATTGNVLTTTDADNNVTTFQYDNAGNLASVTAPDNSVLMSASYNAAGQPTSMTQNGVTQTFGYDSNGRLASNGSPRGTLSFTYDANGYPASVTNAAGKTAQVQYDSSGNLLSISGPNGPIATYTYDGDAHLVSVSDAMSGSRTLTYDSLGRLTKVRDANGATETLQYDAANQVQSSTDRDQVTTTYTHDVDGHVMGVSAPSYTLAYTYDPVGRMLTASDAVATVTLGYDGAGRAVSESESGPSTPSTTIARGFDPAGNLISETGPNGASTRTYDVDGRLKVIHNSSGDFTFGYGSGNQLVSMSRPNGATDTIGYDTNGRPSERTTTTGGSVVSQAIYTYTTGGQIASVKSLTDTASYSYDAVGRLTSIQHTDPGLAAETFTYDSRGNRTSWSGNPGTTTFGADDSLASAPGASFGYDAEGQRTTETTPAGTTTYTWTPGHQLSSVQPPGATVTTYGYDALNRRVLTATGSTTNGSVWDGSDIVADYSQGQLAAAYTPGATADGQLEMVRGGQAYYFVRDHMQSVTDLLDSSGQVASSYSYSGYGTAIGPAPTLASPFGFAGAPFDSSTGAYYNRARYLDPANGVFLSQDLLPSLNTYAYAGGDPVELRDPTGMQIAGYGAILDFDLTLADRLLGCGSAVLASVVEYEIAGHATGKYDLGGALLNGTTGCLLGAVFPKFTRTLPADATDAQFLAFTRGVAGYIGFSVLVGFLYGFLADALHQVLCGGPVNWGHAADAGAFGALGGGLGGTGGVISGASGISLGGQAGVAGTVGVSGGEISGAYDASGDQSACG